jgi:hypothetical protein
MQHPCLAQVVERATAGMADARHFQFLDCLFDAKVDLIERHLDRTIRSRNESRGGFFFVS